MMKMNVLKISKFFLLISLLSVISCGKHKMNPKIWLHRSNNIAKAQYFEDKYAGLELDVHFVDSLNMFIIKHDMEESSTITLDNWFASLKNPSRLGVWLDFKNLNNDNKERAVNVLKMMRQKYNLRGKIYVESWNANSLDVFKKEGFKTSFYIPCDNPGKLDGEGLAKLENKIQKVIENNDVDAISGYYFQYEFMRDKFPQRNKLIWYECDNQEIKDFYIDIANNDDNVEILLVYDKIPD